MSPSMRNPRRSQVVLVPGAPKDVSQMSGRMTLYHEDGTPVLPQIVRGPFEFTRETSGLDEGVEIYTPIVGEVVLNVIVEVIEEFELSENEELPGPRVFLGQFQTETNLIFSADLGGLGIKSGKTDVFYTDDPLLVILAYADFEDSTDPRGGDPVVSSTGHARLYLVTASPTPFA
jgi:hypothetical protein